MDALSAIEHMVRDLNVDRDTWQAVALQYKEAFEAQTARLQELQDICFATQAELENERAQNQNASSLDGFEQRFGTATVYSPSSVGAHASPRPPGSSPSLFFQRVNECAAQRNYGCALAEVERLLRGPLSAKARAEGLLLKSTILRASGPDELFDALAACSEAIELCSRLSDLENLLPRIQYQRGLLYYELRVLHQVHGASSQVSDDGLFSSQHDEFRRSCDNELDLLRCAKRRSGFDESRTMEGLLAHLEEKATDVCYISFHGLS